MLVSPPPSVCAVLILTLVLVVSMLVLVLVFAPPFPLLVPRGKQYCGVVDDVLPPKDPESRAGP